MKNLYHLVDPEDYDNPEFPAEALVVVINVETRVDDDDEEGFTNLDEFESR